MSGVRGLPFPTPPPFPYSRDSQLSILRLLQTRGGFKQHSLRTVEDGSLMPRRQQGQTLSEGSRQAPTPFPS